MDAWRETEQWRKEYCDANDLSYHRFVYWRKKLEGGAQRERARVRGSFATVMRKAPVDTG